MNRHPLLVVREDQVMRLVCAGRSEGEIAHELGISPHTVHQHRDNARQKLAAASLPAAAAAYSRWLVMGSLIQPAPRRRRSTVAEGQLEAELTA